MKRYLIVLLTLFLVGCETKIKYVYIEKPTPILPPDNWLEDCVGPEYKGKTWKDIAAHGLNLEETIALCNTDKKALRQWKKDNSEATPQK